MFKKLGDAIGRQNKLLTVRCTEAYLQMDGVPTLFVTITDDMEVLTSSREREEHYKSASPRLREQLDYWESKRNTVNIATPAYPLEIFTGDVAPILVIEGKKYLLSFFRDIYPAGYLVPGGCSKDIEEVLNPKNVAMREFLEEVLIADIHGRVYNCTVPAPNSQLKDNLIKWKITPKEIISVFPLELRVAAGHAQKIVIKYIHESGRESTSYVRDANVTISPEVASVSVTLFWEIGLPMRFEELCLFDGETLPDGTLLNRPVRLTDERGEVAAIFSRGVNVLKADWHLPSNKMRMFIP